MGGIDLLKDSGANALVDALTKALVDNLASALKGDDSGYEIYASSTKGLSVEARDGVVDAFKVRSGAGVGLRTLRDGRPGFSFSTVSPSEEPGGVALEMVETALSGSTETTVDKDLSFAEPSSPPTADFSGLFDPSISTASEEEKIEAALMIEKSAVEYDKAVMRVRGASFSESLSAWRVLNSRGVDVTGGATYFTGSVMSVAGRGGDSQMGYEAALGHKRGDVDPAWVGKEAARRAVEALGAGRIETRKGSVVFENMVVIELLGALAGSFFAGNAAKGKSMLAGREGEKVVSELINIYDDGVLAGGWASAPFDSEGAARRKTPLISEGVCAGFLYDTYWGTRLGHASTGNAVRGSFKGSPSVGTTNLYMEKGDVPLEGLFERMGDGLFITEMMGVHTVDTVTGEFSLGASGFLVEGGKVAAPVRGFAVSGTLLELLSCVEAVGSDIRHLGSVGAPSLLVCDVDASGA